MLTRFYYNIGFVHFVVLYCVYCIHTRCESEYCFMAFSVYFTRQLIVCLFLYAPVLDKLHCFVFVNTITNLDCLSYVLV